MVLAAFFGFSLFSIMTVATGLFMQLLGSEFGWSRAQASSGVSIADINTVALSPFFGILIGRWGTRMLALLGLVLMSLLVDAFSPNTGSFGLVTVLWLI